jgi:hypothetical protein
VVNIVGGVEFTARDFYPDVPMLAQSLFEK